MKIKYTLVLLFLSLSLTSCTYIENEFELISLEAKNKKVEKEIKELEEDIDNLQEEVDNFYKTQDIRKEQYLKEFEESLDLGEEDEFEEIENIDLFSSGLKIKDIDRYLREKDSIKTRVECSFVEEMDEFLDSIDLLDESNEDSSLYLYEDDEGYNFLVVNQEKDNDLLKDKKEKMLLDIEYLGTVSLEEENYPLFLLEEFEVIQ